MRMVSVEYYICPTCRESGLDVSPSKTVGDQIQTGELKCRGCSASFEIRECLPRFVPGDQYASSFGFQWNKFRKTQLDSNTGKPLSADRLFAASGWPRSLQGQVVVEAGSGAGRFTEVLVKTGATVLSFDLSSATEANFANNGTAPNLHLFQASIYDIPLRDFCCDRLVCLGVLQHTPDPERSFASLVRLVKPGGEIVVDVYAKRLSALLSWKYILRPLTLRLDQRRLFSYVERAVTILLPLAVFLRTVGGALGARLMPILQYSHWGLRGDMNREWAILDTFDMYSPVHDHPRSEHEVRRWFNDAGFEDVVVAPGLNGVVARGKRPKLSAGRDV